MPAVEAIATWAVQNSDPANLVALGLLYWRLKQEHRDMRHAIRKLAEEHPNLTEDEVLPADD